MKFQIFEATGKVHKVFPTQTLGDKGFKKRTMLIEPHEQEAERYKDYIALTVTKDRCAEFDNFAIGEEVKARFFVSSREWKERVFTELMLVTQGLTRMGAKVETPPVAEPPPVDDGSDAASDNLPF